MLLHACTAASRSEAPAEVPAPPPFEPGAETIPQAPPSQAVALLVAQAEAARARNDLEQATAKLERALRIAPNDAALWHRLAEVRLAQGQPLQAETLAAKSNRLAYGDHALKRHNWRIIAQARRLAGDEAGAEEAERRAAAAVPYR